MSIIDGLGLREFNFSSTQTPTPKQETEAFFKFLEEEVKVTVPVHPAFNQIEIARRLDSEPHVGFYIAQQIFKTLISEAHLTHLEFDFKLLNFLKQEGTLVYRKAVEDEIMMFFLYKELIVNLRIDSMKLPKLIKGISLYHSLATSALPPEIEKFIVTPKSVPKIGLIKTNQYGPYVSWIDFTSDHKFSFDYYNDDFKEFSDDLNHKISTIKTGLYLFHGEPGTGKSSSIKHIVSQVNRQFIFIAPQMVHCLSNPEFTSLVTDQLKDSVLIIEDAEKALMKRASEDAFHNSELVSCLLNLTDGIYADMAGTSIIATYNCERSLIDPALLRKGRLRSEYHFKKLSVEKSQKLMDKQGHKVDVEEPMTLADIFNYETQYTNNKAEKKRSVGFGR